MSRTSNARQSLSPLDDAWDVFELDDDLAADPEPEYGDFWGETDDDCDNRGR